MLSIDWKELKYRIADKLFGAELDEAFNMGIREGAGFAVFKMNFDVKMQKHLGLTKTEQKGYNKAIEKMEATKEEIQKTTGAKL